MSKEVSKFGSFLKKSATKTVSERIKESLDQESYEDYKKAMLDPAVSSPAIQRALKNMGVEVHVVSIQRMRKKEKL
jgi:ribosome maturation factor RimP